MRAINKASSAANRGLWGGASITQLQIMHDDMETTPSPKPSSPPLLVPALVPRPPPSMQPQISSRSGDYPVGFRRKRIADTANRSLSRLSLDSASSGSSSDCDGSERDAKARARGAGRLVVGADRTPSADSDEFLAGQRQEVVRSRVCSMHGTISPLSVNAVPIETQPIRNSTTQEQTSHTKKVSHRIKFPRPSRSIQPARMIPSCGKGDKITQVRGRR